MSSQDKLGRSDVSDGTWLIPPLELQIQVFHYIL